MWLICRLRALSLRTFGEDETGVEAPLVGSIRLDPGDELICEGLARFPLLEHVELDLLDDHSALQCARAVPRIEEIDIADWGRVKRRITRVGLLQGLALCHNLDVVLLAASSCVGITPDDLLQAVRQWPRLLNLSVMDVWPESMFSGDFFACCPSLQVFHSGSEAVYPTLIEKAARHWGNMRIIDANFGRVGPAALKLLHNCRMLSSFVIYELGETVTGADIRGLLEALPSLRLTLGGWLFSQRHVTAANMSQELAQTLVEYPERIEFSSGYEYRECQQRARGAPPAPAGVGAPKPRHFARKTVRK
jgi:hypothetical protein